MEGFDRLKGMPGDAIDLQTQIDAQLKRDAQIRNTMGECGTSEPRPNVWSDPRGWAHDICAHHSPTSDGLERIGAIRAAAENLINEILRSCPASGDRGQAISATRMALMFANASIALNGRV